MKISTTAVLLFFVSSMPTFANIERDCAIKFDANSDVDLNRVLYDKSNRFFWYNCRNEKCRISISSYHDERQLNPLKRKPADNTESIRCAGCAKQLLDWLQLV